MSDRDGDRAPVPVDETAGIGSLAGELLCAVVRAFVSNDRTEATASRLTALADAVSGPVDEPDPDDPFLSGFGVEGGE